MERQGALHAIKIKPSRESSRYLALVLRAIMDDTAAISASIIGHRVSRGVVIPARQPGCRISKVSRFAAIEFTHENRPLARMDPGRKVSSLLKP
jgi:hypothetical protein